MVEAQALDRVHRIGQKRDVVTVRYITNNSIETVGLLLRSSQIPTLPSQLAKAHKSCHLVRSRDPTAEIEVDSAISWRFGSGPVRG